MVTRRRIIHSINRSRHNDLYKGCPVRLLFFILSIVQRELIFHYSGSTAGLVLTQVVHGLGGGIAACSTQTAVQAVVSHQDVASVTAVYLLAAEIGGAIGTTIAGAVWRKFHLILIGIEISLLIRLLRIGNYMPLELDRTLAGLANQTTIDNIFGSIYSASSYPINSPILNGVISACKL